MAGMIMTVLRCCRNLNNFPEKAGVPFMSKIPWGRLLNILADFGYCINNYPDISIPGSTTVDFGKYKPLRYLPLEELNQLINAIISKDHPCTFKPYRSHTPRDIRGMTATPSLHFTDSIICSTSKKQSTDYRVHATPHRIVKRKMRQKDVLERFC